MGGSIPNEFIDQLLSQVDIVDVVGRHVRLKKAGKEFVGLCPFHNEKSPSFSVSPAKQFYHCFGCGAHGSAIGFLMEHENLSFVDAVEDLARDAALPMPRTATNSQVDRSAPLIDVSREAAKFFYLNLQSQPADSPVKRYLATRGLNADAIKKFGIGYAPDDWRQLMDSVGANKTELLMKAGLVIQNENGKTYDRFRNRLMFPIRNRKGQVIAFGGRVLDDSKPKYLNSPESPIFHKGRELYGLYEAQQINASLPYVIVTEGYMDVVSLARYGVTSAIATLGTAMTAEHGKKLSRVTNQIVFCFDGDRAGKSAAWRALENMMPVLRPELKIKFLLLPEGEDPDTLVSKQGKAGFEQALESSRSLPEFISETLKEKYDATTMDGRAAILAAAEPLVKAISDSAYRTVLGEHIAKMVNTSAARLIGTSNESDNKRRVAKYAKTTPRDEIKRPLIRVALALLLQHPDLAVKYAPFHNLSAVGNKGIEVLLQLADYILEHPNATTGMILEHWRDREFFTNLAKLATWEHLVPDSGYDREFSDTLERLQDVQFHEQLDTLQAKLESEGLSNEEMDNYRKLLQTRSALG